MRRLGRARALRLALGVLALPAVALLASAGGAAAEPSVTILPLGFGASEFRGPASRVAATIASTDAFREARPKLAGPLVVAWGPGGGAVLSLGPDGAVAIRRAARGVGDFVALERGRDAAPGTRVQSEGPLSAELVGASRDYPHEALGTSVHPTALVISERRPSLPTGEPRPVARDVTRIEAGPGFVFEDREPHVVHLGRDGSPVILLVRSDRQRGSGLVVVGWRDGAWKIVAETPPDGEPFRWLNPIGDLGRPPLLALVRRPHLDGVLQVLRLAGDRLELVAERPGYANHAFGSAAQALAAALPGEGPTIRLAVPTLDRKALAILAVSEGAGIVEAARIPLPARALTGVAALGSGANLHVLVGLEDGEIADVRL